MSISATGNNYISNESFDEWMQGKVAEGYAEMREGMDVSGDRGAAQKALNAVKNQLAQMKTNGTDAQEVTVAMRKLIAEYGEEFPEIKEALGKFSESLDKREKEAIDASNQPTTIPSQDIDNPAPTIIPATHIPEPVKLQEKEIDDMTNAIKDVVDGFGTDDQLGIIHLNQLNSNVHQTESTYSALIDSRNKTADAIINRIA